MMSFIQQFYQDCLVKFAPMGYAPICMLSGTWDGRIRSKEAVYQDCHLRGLPADSSWGILGF